MNGHRFTTGAEFIWKDQPYRVTGRLPGRRIHITNTDTGEINTVDEGELVHALLLDKTLAFVIAPDLARRSPNGEPMTEHKYLSVHEAPERLKAVACWREEAIRPLLDLPPGSRTHEAIDAQVAAIKANPPVFHVEPHKPRLLPISRRSAYRWITDYEAGGLRALIPTTAGERVQGQVRIEALLEAAVTQAIQDHYLKSETVSADAIRQIVAAVIDKEDEALPPDQRRIVPSRATIARRIAALPVQERIAAKQGKRAARQAVRQYGKTEYPEIPLARVEMDHTPTDFIVIDDVDDLPLGRLTLTVCLDMATRYPLGYYLGFEPPSYYAVAECLYHAIMPKASLREKYSLVNDWLAYGIPGTLIVDNGKEFIGNSLEEASQGLGFVIKRSPPRTPQFKGGIERFLGTVARGFFHSLPGTSFSSPSQRGDYDSAKQACIYLSKIDEILNRYLIDIYAQTKHRGLGAKPAEEWKRKTEEGFVPRVPSSGKELTILLSQTETRSLWHYGIEWANLRYNHRDLGFLRAELKNKNTVTVRRHPSDLSRIWVWNPLDRCYIEVPALDQGYTQNLSAWKHRVIQEWVRTHEDKMDIAALGRARLAIQEGVDKSRTHHKVQKKMATRTRISRWESTGRPASELAGSGAPEPPPVGSPPALPPPSSSNVPAPGPPSTWNCRRICRLKAGASGGHRARINRNSAGSGPHRM